MFSIFQLVRLLTVLTATPGMTPGAMTPGTGLILRWLNYHQPTAAYWLLTIYFQSHMPPTSPCEGCCVKMVQFIGTHHYQIKRTCTDSFEVNFFMVNHACMTEGHRHGHMCFCEDDECNGVEMISSRLLLMSFPIVMTVVMGYFRWPSDQWFSTPTGYFSWSPWRC